MAAGHRPDRPDRRQDDDGTTPNATDRQQSGIEPQQVRPDDTKEVIAPLQDLT